MLIPFCSKIEVAGRACTRFWRKILPVGVEIFQTNRRLRPWGSRKPRTTFADKKGTASVSLTSHKVEIWKEAKVQSRNNEEKRMWLLPVITGYDLYWPHAPFIEIIRTFVKKI